MGQRTETREKIVLAAFQLFLIQGYNATGLAQVAREAGVNNGSIYYFFPTKEDLMAAVLEWCKANLWSDVIQPVFDRVSDPVERVFGILDGYRRMLLMTEFGQGCPMGNWTLEVGETLPNVRRLIAENFEGWRQAVKLCLDDAADRFPSETDRDALATFVLTTMEGAVMLARTFRSFEHFDAAVSQLRDHVERLLAEGAAWRPPAPAPRRGKSAK